MELLGGNCKCTVQPPLTLIYRRKKKATLIYIYEVYI